MSVIPCIYIFLQYDNDRLLISFKKGKKPLQRLIAGLHTAEVLLRLREPALIIWHNYPTESVNLGDVSVNYLAAVMLEQTGLALSDYQRYTLWQFQKVPVITSRGAKDAQGKSYPTGSDQYRALTRDYRLLIYNHTVDIEGRREDFFGR